MKILTVYGFHKEEREFGELVCNGYHQIYSPDSSFLVTQPIVNSAPQCDKLQEEISNQEICSLIRTYKPKVFIDIHHSSGTSLKFRLLFESYFNFHPQKKKNRFVFLMDRLLRIKEKEINNPPDQIDDMIRYLAQPLLVSYWNPEVNPDFFDYLSKQTDLFTMLKLDNAPNGSKFEVATKNSVSYVSLEAMLNGENGNIDKDGHYYATVEMSMALIHRIHEHIYIKEANTVSSSSVQ